MTEPKTPVSAASVDLEPRPRRKPRFLTTRRARRSLVMSPVVVLAGFWAAVAPFLDAPLDGGLFAAWVFIWQLVDIAAIVFGILGLGHTVVERAIQWVNAGE